jgi:NADPH-dependent curcumin reductase CurA
MSDPIPSTYQHVVVASRPEGAVSTRNFSVETVDLLPLADGEFLIRTEYLMVNPPAVVVLNRGLAKQPPIPIGNVMWGAGTGRVVASMNENFAVGDVVSGSLGWTEYAVSDGATKLPVNKLPLPPGTPSSIALHVLGASGLTAYFGLIDLAHPKAGETVLVSGAAGSVGNCVCQLALDLGCTVIAIAGSEEKGAWLTSLGVQHFINYKTSNVAERIAEIAPSGVDIFFDNVGGETLEAALLNLAMHARIIICGATSQYQTSGAFSGPANYFELAHAEATMRGFHIFHYLDRVPEAMARLMPMVKQGKLRYREDILEGIARAPDALVRVFAGENEGTQLVKVS